MDVLRDVFLIIAAFMVVAGSVAVVVAEFASSAQRRLVPRWRDTIEVMLPPLMAIVLVWLVWLEYS